MVSGIAEHHADLLADLVDEDHRRLALADRAGQLPHRLAHQPGLQADVRIADFAFEFLLGHQGGHGVDDDHVHGVGADQHFRDVHGLFAAARLADQEGFQLDAQLLGPTGVQGVLGVDEGRDAALALRLGHHVQGQRGLAAGFRSEDLDYPPAGNSLPAQGHVERQAAGGDAGDAAADSGAQGHDGPLAKLLFDLGHRGLQGGMGVQHGADAVVLPAAVLADAFVCTVFFAIGSFAFVLVDVTMGRFLQSVILRGKGMDIQIVYTCPRTAARALWSHWLPFILPG